MKHFAQMQRSQLYCKAEAGKGFGTVKHPKPAKKKPKVAFIDGKQDAVQQAIKLSEDSKGTTTSSVDSQEAANGRVDYAKVKNWGGEKLKDPGSLQLQSFFPGQSKNVEEMKFYNRLSVRVLQAKESGILEDILNTKLPIAPPPDLPDERRWKFTKRRYIQYLVDLQALYHSMESGIAEASAARSDGDILKAAVDCLGEQKGLDRSLEIATDLTNLDHSTEESSHPGPSLHILAQLKYLKELTQDVSSDENTLKFLAHVFAVHLYHFTRGSAAGAKIAQSLNLFSLNAVHFFRSYPKHDQFPNKDPMKAFIANVDELGTHLNEQQMWQIEEELPTALAFICMLIMPVAKE